jgi:hypothetical protein
VHKKAPYRTEKPGEATLSGLFKRKTLEKENNKMRILDLQPHKNNGAMTRYSRESRM